MINWAYVTLLLAIIFGVMVNKNKNEGFSKSGLNMSDRRCKETVGFYRPGDRDEANRQDYQARICSPLRRKIIDEETGNYFDGAPANHVGSPYI